MAVSGSVALVADDSAGLRVIDISVPSRPREAGFLDIPRSARGVAVSGSLALVADYDGGLVIVQISGPPKVAGVVALQGLPPASGTTVSFKGPETKSVITGPGGSFSVELQSGSYVVRAEHTGHLPAEATFELELGETLKLDAVLRHGPGRGHRAGGPGHDSDELRQRPRPGQRPGGPEAYGSELGQRGKRVAGGA